MVAETVIGAVGCLAGLGLGFGVGRAGKGKGSNSQSANGVPEKKAILSPTVKWMMSPSGAMASPTNTGLLADTGRSKGKQLDFSTTGLTSKITDLSQLGISTELDEDAFVETLRQLIAESKHLQNNPRLNVTPEERRAADVVKNLLADVSGSNGPLIIEDLEYVPGRPNLKITYPGSAGDSKTVGFIGSHMDVVPADPETWSRDPFQLTVEGDKLYGRGTTDCLGHVALLTRFLYELGKTKPDLQRTIIVIFIAAEEGGEHGVGIDMCVKHGKMEELKNGPVYWVDVADSQPCLGTVGSLSWSMTAKGRLFHSGFPHKGINSIELAAVAMDLIQERFYEDFPPKPDEETYMFAVGSSFKPTQMECQKGSFNQICPSTTYHGDIRLSPFYTVSECMQKVDEYVEYINSEMTRLPTRGAYSRFSLDQDVEIQAGELRQGKIEWKWNGTLENFQLYEGVACNLDSPGHKALVQAFRETHSSVKPFAVNGTLPLVSSMKQAGFDLQLCGFGLMKVYHGIDEYCQLSDMKKAYETVLRVTTLLDKH